MKIGFDGKRAVKNMTGLGNYSRLVLESIARECPDDNLVVYTPEMRPNARLNAVLEMPNVRFATPHSPFAAIARPVWRSWNVTATAAKDRIDIFHGLSNELPLNFRSSGIPSVLTVHDLIYRRLPYCYKPADRVIYDLKYGRSCRIADTIVAISECTKRDIMEYYGVPEEKITVVYQGCHDIFRHEPDRKLCEAVRRRYNLPKRYLLQVGTIERRKNLELSVRAMQAVPADVHLVAVGRDNNYLERVRAIAEEAGVAERIHYIHDAAFTHLPALNRMAEIILYPSRYEGFGIPVLEGLESRRPVIAATGSCLEEAGCVAALYVDPDSPRQLAEAINAILDHTIDTNARIHAGQRHAARFDNGLIAARLMDVYRHTIASFAARRH